MELEEIALLMLGFSLRKDALLVGQAGCEQVIVEASQLVGGRGDGFRGAKFGAHAPVIMAERRLIVMQGVGRDAQRESGAVLHMTGAYGEYLAAADAVVGTQP